MKAYQITISKVAQKQLDKLSDNVAERLIDAIYKLSENPRPPGFKKLNGRDGCRIRVGDYKMAQRQYFLSSYHRDLFNSFPL